MVTFSVTPVVDLKKEMEPNKMYGVVWVWCKDRDMILRDCLSRLHEGLEKSRSVMKAVQR